MVFALLFSYKLTRIYMSRRPLAADAEVSETIMVPRLWFLYPLRVFRIWLHEINPWILQDDQKQFIIQSFRNGSYWNKWKLEQQILCNSIKLRGVRSDGRTKQPTFIKTDTKCEAQTASRTPNHPSIATVPRIITPNTS